MTHDQTQHLNLPYLAPGQAQKHVTLNEDLLMLDAVTQLTVDGRGANAPPASPAGGARFIVGPAPTGAWAGAPGSVVHFVDGAWMLQTPREHWLARSRAEGALLVFGGAE